MKQNAVEASLHDKQPKPERKMANWMGNKDQVDPDFVHDADYFMLQQEPLRAKILIKAIFIILVVFVAWAAIATLDEITKGEGKVIPSRQLQVLQSLDGGIVSEINIQEGQIVEAGQILLKIDSTRFESSVRESRTQYLALSARAARLRALAEDKSFTPPKEVLLEDPATAEEERRLYQSGKSNLDAQVSIARQQLIQRQQELAEMRAKRDQAAQAYDLTAKEWAVTKPLINSGAVSEVELLRLERDTARFRGERDMADAQIARALASINEANRKIEEVTFAFRNQIRTELSETMAKFNAVSEGGVGLADKVKHSMIRSPVKGTVKRLMVNTVGGVVQAGRDVIEIVPLEDALILETKIAPKDIAFLRTGQKAMVKFTAYDFSVYGALPATLEHIGADSITDEKDDITYFMVRVRTENSQLGPNLPIIPGMVAEVDIITGEKSVLTYLFKPILRAKQAAFTER